MVGNEGKNGGESRVLRLNIYTDVSPKTAKITWPFLARTAAHRLRCASAIFLRAAALNLRLFRVVGLAVVPGLPISVRRVRAASSLRISASMPAMIELVSMQYTPSEFYLLEAMTDTNEE